MGTPFPAGLVVSRLRGREDLLPWLWGVNGVCSVLGTFLATAISLFAGARVVGLLGVGCYIVACGAMWLYTRSLRNGTE